MDVKRVQIIVEAVDETVKPLVLEYDAEKYVLDVQLSSSRGYARGFQSMNFNEVGQLVPTGQNALTLEVRAVNKSDEAAYREWKGRMVEVQSDADMRRKLSTLTLEEREKYARRHCLGHLDIEKERQARDAELKKP